MLRKLPIRGLTTLLLAALGAGPALAQTAVPPNVSQISFAPATIPNGATSQLSIVFGNTNATAATLTATLTDALPSGLTLANGTAAGSCTAGAVRVAAGGNTVTYAAGAAIPAGGCTISVTVKGTTATASTYYTDSIPAGALQTNLGNNPTGASGTLNVRTSITVPKLVGLTRATAATSLTAAGLVLGAVQYGTGPAGTPFNAIYAQVPAAGAAIASGSAVSITISIGKATNPNAPLTSVPGLVVPGQESVAGALERLCTELEAPAIVLTAAQANTLANCRAILNTYGGGINAAGLEGTLNAISGREATAIQRTALLFAGNQFTNIGARLAQLRQGVSGMSFAGLDTGLPMQGLLAQLFTDPEPSSDSDDRSSGRAPRGPRAGGGAGDPNSDGADSPWGFFINGALRRGTEGATVNESGFDYKSNGITAGIDYRFTNHLVFGAALGRANANTDFIDDSSRLDSRDDTASLYGTYYSDAWYVDWIGSFSRFNYDADRTTTYTIDPSVSMPLPTNCAGSQCTINTTGATDARQLAFGTSAGYTFHEGGMDFGPDVSVNYTHLSVRSFTESDSDNSGMLLAFGNQLGESLTLKAGGHASYAISTPFAVILPQLTARYIHEFKNDERALQVHFEDDPSVHSPTGPVSTFLVYTDQPDRSYFDWSAGVTAQFPYGISAFGNYNALAGESNIRLHEYAFGVRFQYPFK